MPSCHHAVGPAVMLTLQISREKERMQSQFEYALKVHVHLGAMKPERRQPSQLERSFVLLATQKRNLVENFDDFSRDDFSKWSHRTLSFTHMQCWEMLFWLISTITFQHVSPHLDDTSASVANSFWMCLQLDNRRKNSKTVGLRSPAWPDLDSIDGCLDLSVFTEWNSYHCLLLALLSSSKP